MSKKNKLLDRSNYLLTRYQNEIFRQLSDYMERNNLSQRDVAKALDVSDAYISQILNGDFNFTLKKLIELSLFMGKAPVLSFIDKDEYWLLRDKSHKHFTFTMSVEKMELSQKQLSRVKEKTKAEKKIETSLTVEYGSVNLSELCLQ